MALRRISLRNFIIVQALDLDLEKGFTALTGETGAGKSILIDALQLTLGSRADADVVREGSTQADLSAEFDPPPAHSPLHTWLHEHGFAPSAGQANAAEQPGPPAPPPAAEPLLLRRVIDTQGRSRAWVNGCPATATQLRHLGAQLVDIHGQHAWQSLTQPDAVRDLLDAYAANAPARERVRSAWQHWRHTRSQLDAAIAAQDSARDECERLQWQIDELSKLNPRSSEWAELNTQHERLSHAQSLLNAAQNALHLLQDDSRGAQGPLQRACALLQEHTHLEPDFHSVAEALAASLAQIDDARHSLHTWLRHTHLEPHDLAALDERLSLWMQLSRRYRRPPAELPELLQHWRERLNTLDQAINLDALHTAHAQAQADWQAANDHLAQGRAAAAPRLAAAITQAMQGLGMQGGRFEVSLHSTDPGPHGAQGVQFLVAAHPGATPRPIARVASGGELSRLSLAIAVATSELGTAPTLIFDEIDSGIGGAVAEVVGRLMRSLGQNRQVLAVTHLPQVAACAHAHCLVSKQRPAPKGPPPSSAQDTAPADTAQTTTNTNATTSTITPLNAAQREHEIARMLGGEVLSPTTLAHAREMLNHLNPTPAPTRRKS